MGSSTEQASVDRESREGSAIAAAGAGLPGWLAALGEGGRDCVLVTVADTRGSTPRESGAKMLVTAESFAGTIGGGNLEFQAIEFAREKLRAEHAEGARCVLRRFPLGPTLGQCCGGVAILHFERLGRHLARDPESWCKRLTDLRAQGQVVVAVGLAEGAAGGDRLLVTERSHQGGLGNPELDRGAIPVARDLLQSGGTTGLRRVGPGSTQADPGPLLLFEMFRPDDWHVVLFGAGHVGRALVRILATLPCSVTWVDSREDQFPQDPPANVTVAVREAPEVEVQAAPAGSYFLVITHSHPLDQRICGRILARDDFSYCGLIGSQSKRRKFEKRLSRDGTHSAALARLTCPIGVEGIPGKQPAEIAVAVAAELLQVRAQVPLAEPFEGIAHG